MLQKIPVEGDKQEHPEAAAADVVMIRIAYQKAMSGYCGVCDLHLPREYEGADDDWWADGDDDGDGEEDRYYGYKECRRVVSVAHSK